MSINMIAIELNPKTIDHIMAVAAFVWPTLTTEELVKTLELAPTMYQTFYFIPQFISKFSSPHQCAHAVFVTANVLREDFDYEITDPTKPFPIARKS